MSVIQCLSAMYVCLLITCFPAAQCPPLTPESNTMITYGPDTTPEYDVGTVAMHNCTPGFEPNANAARVCQSDGTFSGFPVRCFRIRKWQLFFIQRVPASTINMFCIL